MRARLAVHKKRYIAFNLTIILLLLVIFIAQFQVLFAVRSMLKAKQGTFTAAVTSTWKDFTPIRWLTNLYNDNIDSHRSMPIEETAMTADRKELLPFLESSWKPEYARNGSVFDYLGEYRNPCWIEEVPAGTVYDENRFLQFFNTYDRSNQFKRVGEAFVAETALLRGRALTTAKNWRFRCLPSFYMVGVHKAGTTDFYDALVRHPSIAAPIIKESNFWFRSMEVGMTFEDYLQLYDPVAEMIRKNEHMVTLDASPENFFLWNHTEFRESAPPANPRFIANQLRALNPSAKIILMLRDPVTWLYSLYGHVRRDFQSPEEFDECVVNAISDFNECVIEKSVEQCAIIVMKREACPIAHSIYYIYLEEWLKIFPRNQLLIIRSEDYFADRLGTLRETYAFLELPPLTDSEERFVLSQDVRNKGRGAKPMWDSTREALQTFTQPHNSRLAEILKDERFAWKRED